MLRALAISIALSIAACSPPGPANSSVSTAVSMTRPSPETAVEAFATALRSGDTNAVSRLMAPDVVIAESGEVERSYAEYAAHHLPADVAFTAAVTFTLQNRKVIVGGDMATVISHSEVRGAFRGRAIHSNSMETMVLRWMDGAWIIVHIHWSSSPIAD